MQLPPSLAAAALSCHCNTILLLFAAAPAAAKREYEPIRRQHSNVGTRQKPRGVPRGSPRRHESPRRILQKERYQNARIENSCGAVYKETVETEQRSLHA